MDNAAAIRLIRSLYGGEGPVQLHEPVFLGNEKAYLAECVDSTMVSSVGPFVDRLERELAALCGVRRAVATVNGTAALHAALRVAGVGPGDVVVTQAVSFVATANAVAYCGARPAFVDVSPVTCGMCPGSLSDFLRTRVRRRAGGAPALADTGERVAACVPVHVFGHPCEIEALAAICGEWGVPLVEDAAEAIGSASGGRACGSFGRMGVLSFNGNKALTAGGGGAILTDDPDAADAAKHLTTTAKTSHPWEYVHDRVGFNYRMPNVNAALAVAQLESLPLVLANKRETAEAYRRHFESEGVPVVWEPPGTRSNFWLNAILLPSQAERDAFLAEAHAARVLARPLWRPLNRLPMYRDCPSAALPVTERLAETLVNLPSGYRRVRRAGVPC